MTKNKAERIEQIFGYCVKIIAKSKSKLTEHEKLIFTHDVIVGNTQNEVIFPFPQ